MYKFTKNSDYCNEVIVTQEKVDCFNVSKSYKIDHYGMHTHNHWESTWKTMAS